MVRVHIVGTSQGLVLAVGAVQRLWSAGVGAEKSHVTGFGAGATAAYAPGGRGREQARDLLRFGGWRTAGDDKVEWRSRPDVSWLAALPAPPCPVCGRDDGRFFRRGAS